MAKEKTKSFFRYDKPPQKLILFALGFQRLFFIIVFTAFFIHLACREDPVGKYIATLQENIKHPLDRLDLNKEFLCIDAIEKLTSHADDPRVVPVFIDLLKHSWASYRVKNSAIIASGYIKDLRLVPSLVSWVKSVKLGHNPTNCKSAVWALGEIGDPSAVPDLIEVFVVKKEEVSDWEKIVPHYPNEPNYESLREQKRQQTQEIIEAYSAIRNEIINALIKIDKKHDIFPLADITPIAELLKDSWSSYEAANLLEIMKDKRAKDVVQEISPKRFVYEKRIVQNITSPFFYPKTLAISPNGTRFAYVETDDNKDFVVLDGINGKPYDGRAGNIIFSPDSRRFVYLVQTAIKKFFIVVDGIEKKKYDGIGGVSPLFSPDSKRLAYAAFEKNKWYFIVDDKEEGPYDNLGDTLTFSPDSKRFAYVAGIGNKRFVVVEGKKGKLYDNIGKGGLIFSPDGKRTVYSARIGNKYLVVVDGKEEKLYDRILSVPTFSQDSKQLAYSARDGNKSFIVVNGKEEKAYDSIGEDTPIFSPDGKRIAYVIVVDDKWIVVVDGKEGKQYDDIASTFLFSPDSKRLAYIARRGNKQTLVVDGKEGKLYDGILKDTFVFSPDSKRFAYAARESYKYAFVVIDDIEQKRYDGIANLIFSPNGNRVAYMAKLGDKRVVVIDGKDNKLYDDLVQSSIIFSADGKHVSYGAKSGDKWFMVLDGKEGISYDESIMISKEASFSANSSNMLHYLGLKGSSLYLVEETIK